ncbi:hypothetical protein N658DRAFT_492525 [Parathielavia hyrcaniae]|uniref:Uncharacterized protein n=1 Tax=Parathielavia hyrcaniae TaxID=113614 RepID=A0AAN6QBX4_9PEZI|nr:hypothetical protein N658DRAFT_492525 [Parathielavia hyrcaniae]
MTDLIRELQETNRLLREIVSQKAVQQPSPRPTKQPLPPAANGSSSSATSTLGAPGLVMDQMRHLADDLAHAAFGSGNLGRRQQLRDRLISRWNRVRGSRLPFGTDKEIWLSLRMTGTLSHTLQPLSQAVELVWQHRDTSVFRDLGLTGLEIERQWPVQLDPDRLTSTDMRQHGWISGDTPSSDWIFAAHPFVYGHDDMLVPANTKLKRRLEDLESTGTGWGSDAGLVSLGSFWVFAGVASKYGDFPLSMLALVAAVCMMKGRSPDVVHWHTDAVHELLHQFGAAWRPLNHRFSHKGTGPGDGDVTYRHTIRCFSAHPLRALPSNESFIHCRRERGQFSAMPGTTRAGSFSSERRMSVFCHWQSTSAGDAPHFTISVLGDLHNTWTGNQATLY